MAFWSNHFDDLLPAALQRAEPETQRRARLLLAFTLALVIWSPIFAVIYLWLQAPALAAAVLLAGILAFAVPASLRITASVELAGSLLTLDLFGVLCYVGWHTGGVESPVVAWFVAVPMVATLTCGYRLGGLWVVGSLGTIVSLAISGAGQPSLLEGLSSFHHTAWLIAVVSGILLVVSSLTVLCESFKDHALRAMQEANNARSAFLANMSHELRTPLTAILGYTDLLLEEGVLELSAGENEARLQTIRRNGQHLLELINEVLDLSKVEAGKLKIEPVDFSPIRLLQEVASLMQVRADVKGLPLLVELRNELPLLVRSDPTRIRQILFNLIGNAIKFTSKGSIRITAASASTPAGRTSLTFEVIDTGVGISAEQLGRLFEPFVQGDSSSSRQFGGTGLGLAISRRLARLLGGEIFVQSTPGSGSQFRLELAVDLPTGVAARLADSPGSELQGSTPLSQARGPLSNESVANELAGLRLLVAEDGPDNRMLITAMFSRVAARVTTVTNGQEAVEAALAAQDSGVPFDAILMDMQMPVLDGYDAAAELRRCGYRYPIIALTAHALPEDRRKCLEAGCDDYATKPLKRSEIFAILGRVTSAAAAEKSVTRERHPHSV